MTSESGNAFIYAGEIHPGRTPDLSSRVFEEHLEALNAKFK